MMNATYSPDDNKLRLYSTARLDAETYARVRAAGFIWAPKQQLFVAPAWSPEREDLLIELCGEIDDEDKSLVERAEERAERFEDYSDRRADDAESAHKAVSAIADNIPLGQPILVGHHSERHARRDAEKIESGMRKAVKMWETSQYWKQRAKCAIGHAKYKERPDVRARRIKGLEADRRREQRNIEEHQGNIQNWAKVLSIADPESMMKHALYVSNYSRRTPYGTWGELKDGKITPPEAGERAIKNSRMWIANAERWLKHIENRLEYERAMLEDQGESGLLVKKPRPALLPLLNYRQEKFVLKNPYSRGDFITYPQIDMTQAEYTKLHADYKGTRVVDNSHRIRTAMVKHSLVAVFLTDSKVHKKPEKDPPPTSPTPPTVPPRPITEPTAFDFMKETLKQGVKVVTANQLFPTPPELAERMVELAEIEPGQRVLEPSAGTGNILEALRPTGAAVTAIEINAQLAEMLSSKYNPRPPCWCILPGDFLSCNGDLGAFDRIIMNPPFQNGDDIKHIQHALHMLKPGGKLVALCANGPRQQEQLKPLAETWEELPAGTFEGTGVRAALLTITA